MSTRAPTGHEQFDCAILREMIFGVANYDLPLPYWKKGLEKSKKVRARDKGKKLVAFLQKISHLDHCQSPTTELQALTGLSAKQIQRNLKSLEEFGILEIDIRKVRLPGGAIQTQRWLRFTNKNAIPQAQVSLKSHGDARSASTGHRPAHP